MQGNLESPLWGQGVGGGEKVLVAPREAGAWGSAREQHPSRRRQEGAPWLSRWSHGCSRHQSPGHGMPAPGSVKGQLPLPLDQGCKSKRPRLRRQGGPPERVTASDFTCCALLHSGHTRGFPISSQNLPSVIFIFPLKLKKFLAVP